MAHSTKMRNETSTSGGDGGGNGNGDESVVMDVGRRKSTCGYCKSGSRSSISHGLWANSMTVDHYQALLDRGWRRSGCFLYKPEMDKTCCPSYTIRLKASDFIPSKEQVRVSKRMQRFLDGTLDVKKSDHELDKPSISKGSHGDALNCPKSSSAIDSVMECEDSDKSNQVMRSLSDHINLMIQLCLEGGDLPSDIQYPIASIKKVTPTKKKLQAEVSGGLLYSCNIAFLIAATLRRTKKFFEIFPEKIAETIANYSEKISEPRDLSIRACNGHINFYNAAKQENIVEMVRSITKSSNTEIRFNENNTEKRRQDIQARGRNFEIRLQQSSFDSEEYALYRKYQLQVHDDTPDQVTESSYKRFLVDSPLIHVSPNSDVSAPPCGFGSFHQQYLVDGKLIAVGVIDILPKSLSSKYLFWDPDFAFLSLGKFSALEEIRFVRENQVHSPGLQYYYLGYYIHSCRKMRYKAAYRPSELLCPLRYQWVPYDIAKQLLDKNKFAVLSDFTSLQNGDAMPVDVIDNNMEEQRDKYIQEASDNAFRENDQMSELEYEDTEDESDSETSDTAITESEDVDVSNVLIGLKRTRLRLKDLLHAFDPTQRKFFESQLQKYAKVVGTELSEQMVLSLV